VRTTRGRYPRTSWDEASAGTRQGEQNLIHTASPRCADAIAAYLAVAGDSEDRNGPLFRPVSNNTRSGTASITPDGVYKLLDIYVKTLQIDVAGFGLHALRATTATNALDHGADIAKVQEWLSHANIATTKV